MQSHRASSTFCWLPPDNSRIRCSGLAHRMPRRVMKRSTISRLRVSSTTPLGASCGISARVRFSRTDMSGIMPSSLRSSDRKPMPATIAWAGS